MAHYGLTDADRAMLAAWRNLRDVAKMKKETILVRDLFPEGPSRKRHDEAVLFLEGMFERALISYRDAMPVRE